VEEKRSSGDGWLRAAALIVQLIGLGVTVFRSHWAARAACVGTAGGPSCFVRSAITQMRRSSGR